VTEIALLLRLFLAAVFVVAAAAKLTDRAGAAAGLRGFGIPGALAAPLAGAELLVAAGLLAGPAAPALAAALTLTLLFTGVQLAALARGRRPACNCFGARSAAPIGARTLARSTALGVVAAGALAVGPGPGAGAWLADLAPAGRVAVAGAVVLAALVAASGWIVLQLLRAQGRILLRLEALEAVELAPVAVEPEPPARRAPEFELATVGGERITIARLTARGLPIVLVFTDTRCAACESLLPRIAAWQREHAGAVTLALVAAGEPAHLRAKRAEHDLDLVLLDDGDVADRYGVKGTPAAVLIDASGRIAAPPAAGPVGITALVARAAELAPVLAVGSPAPAVALPGADGEAVVLPPDGSRRLVVFWDPTCPACGSAVEDLRAWDRALGPDRLLVVSRGRPEAARALDLGAAVGLDDDAAVTRAFGVRGTPSALLLDAGGAIAAPPAEGVHAIDVLAGVAARSEAVAA
jgi:protein-disulfide isomerase